MCLNTVFVLTGSKRNSLGKLKSTHTGIFLIWEQEMLQRQNCSVSSRVWGRQFPADGNSFSIFWPLEFYPLLSKLKSPVVLCHYFPINSMKKHSFFFPLPLKIGTVGKSKERIAVSHWLAIVFYTLPLVNWRKYILIHGKLKNMELHETASKDLEG